MRGLLPGREAVARSRIWCYRAPSMTKTLLAHNAVVSVVACLVLFTFPSGARANEVAPEPPPRRSALAAGVAIVPGLVVHGAGHVAAGNLRTGYRLLMLEG